MSHIQKLVRGQRVSAVGVLSAKGMLDCHIVARLVNADRFEEFIEQSLLGSLWIYTITIEWHQVGYFMPFNGINSYIVVLDNCSIHHVDHLVNLIENMGVLV